MSLESLKSWASLLPASPSRRPVSRGALAGTWLAALALVVLPSASIAENESRLFIDHVVFDAKDNTLTIHADVLDIKGMPLDNVQPEDLEFSANGVPLKVKTMEVQTSEKAQEPVAIVLLLNGSAAYQVQEGESNSTYQQAKEGAAQFIQHLSGNDKIAVLRYREGFPHEIVYAFASNFVQAKEAAASDVVPASDETPEGIQGSAKVNKTLAPESIRAVDKALNYMVENLDKLGSARRRFIVIMSDGKNRETDNAKLSSKIKSMLEKYEEYKIRIHTIGFTADDPKYLPLLQTMANGSGGVYLKVDTKDLGQIPAVWDSLATRIKRQYIIKLALAELPDNGEPIKGKDEANYVISLKAKMKDGAVAEAAFNDVRLPTPSINWGSILKMVGMVLGGLLGAGLLIFLIIFLVKRKGSDGEAQSSGGRQQREYDGPSRGKLTVLQGPLAGEVFPLIDDVTTIGSMKGNTIIISDGSVSRRHAAIKIDQMRYEVADMNSTNGVLVNGQKIHKVFLKDGDRIQIGSTEVIFTLK